MPPKSGKLIPAGMESDLTQPDLIQQRRQGHALLDVLSAEKLTAVRSLLEVMAEPLSGSLALAQVEDEEITSETAASLDSARASLAEFRTKKYCESSGFADHREK
jgi:hypothetical protein